ncbi:MAG TPA: hemolysin family protein [Mycobacteriales bacterium]|nr:hemolysin family protein [Mycobacteriales bacterium]
MSWTPLLVVVVLILLEGLFVAAEIALVSLRETQIHAMAERDRRGRVVKKLSSDPNRWLSAVQIGVTLCALLASAYGAESYVDPLKRQLRDGGLGKTWASILAFAIVTVILTFVTLVVAELAPKRLALQRAEGTARLLAPALDRMASIVRPIIWLLSKCTDALVRLLGGDPNVQRESISDEELRGLVAAHEGLSSEERRIVDEVFAAAERQVNEVMVPRTEVDFLEGSMTVTAALKAVGDLPHSRYPVTGASSDEVLGFVHVRDLLAANRRGKKVADVMRDITQLPSSKPVLSALSEMRRGGSHLAVIVDEYGGTAGIVTLEDLIEEVIGDIRDEYDTAEAASDVRKLRGGAVEVDGLLNLDDFEEATGIELPDGPYETAAGYVVHRLGHLPRVGDSVDVVQEVDADETDDDAQPRTVATLAVARLDGRRVDRVKVTPK